MWFKKNSTKSEEFDVALLLLYAAERSLTSRKIHEAFHNGSSIGYKENPMVIIKLQQYLSEKKIKERLEELLNETPN